MSRPTRRNFAVVSALCADLMEPPARRYTKSVSGSGGASFPPSRGVEGRFGIHQFNTASRRASLHLTPVSFTLVTGNDHHIKQPTPPFSEVSNYQFVSYFKVKLANLFPKYATPL